MSVLNKSLTGYNQSTGKWNNPSQLFRYIVALDDEYNVCIKLPFSHGKDLSDYYRNIFNSYNNIQYRYYLDGLEVENMREVLK